MDLNDLRLLLYIVDEGSVQRAAQKLGLARTTVRRRLDNLEATVGAPVLLRGPDGATLTAAGEVLVRQGRPLLRQTDTMLTDAKASEYEGETTIRLVVPIGVPSGPRTRAVTMLQATFPKICLEVREVEDPLDVIDQPFDLMVHFGAPLPRSGWFSRVMMRLSMGVLASPAYLERHGTPQCLEDLDKHVILMWRRGPTSLNAWPLKGGGTVPVKPSVVSCNLAFLHDACAEGLGLLLGTQGYPFDGYPLSPVLPTLVGDEETIRVVSPHPSTANSRTRSILVNLTKLLEPLPQM